MSEFAKLREELAKSRPLEFVGRDCACIGCIAHREIGLILRALAIAEVGEEVERALKPKLSDAALEYLEELAGAETESDDPDDVEFNGALMMLVKWYRDSRAALSKLKQAREG